MINELQIKKECVDHKDFQHLEQLEFFKTNRNIQFKKGINLLLAQNGKGKSTLLNILSTGLAAKQGGFSKVTDSWIGQVHPYFDKDKSFMSNFNIIHDGQGIIYQNPRDSFGLMSGYFDDDFFQEGLRNTLSKSSTGLTTLERLGLLFNLFENKEFKSEIGKRKLSEKHKDIVSLLSGQIEKGQKTVLLDEPESGLSLQYQYNLFSFINKKAKELDLQIIISTHSPCLFVFEDANIIELSEGYLSGLEETMTILNLHLKARVLP